MNRQSLCLLLVSILGSWMLPPSANAASDGRLTIEVDGLRNQKGSICFSLFSNEQGFPKRSDRAIATRCVKATASVSTTFDQLAPGTYAVAMIHDANDDGKLNTGFLGIPKEGFGFSRNPRIGTSAPSFQDAAILIGRGSTKIQINLKYLL